jgi:hypothetical protein
MVSFHIDKTNNYLFSKNEFLFKLKNNNSTIYYNIVIWVIEIIQNVTDDNYDDFQHVNSIFPQNFISLFWGLFNDETELSVR